MCGPDTMAISSICLPAARSSSCGARWRLASVEPRVVMFRSVPPPDELEQVLEVLKDDVERLTWDRLPKQQVRSQVRFHLTSGDLMTFSGTLGEPR